MSCSCSWVSGWVVGCCFDSGECSQVWWVEYMASILDVWSRPRQFHRRNCRTRPDWLCGGTTTATICHCQNPLRWSQGEAIRCRRHSGICSTGHTACTIGLCYRIMSDVTWDQQSVQRIEFFSHETDVDLHQHESRWCCESAGLVWSTQDWSDSCSRARRDDSRASAGEQRAADAGQLRDSAAHRQRHHRNTNGYVSADCKKHPVGIVRTASAMSAWHSAVLSVLWSDKLYIAVTADSYLPQLCRTCLHFTACIYGRLCYLTVWYSVWCRW